MRSTPVAGSRRREAGAHGADPEHALGIRGESHHAVARRARTPACSVETAPVCRSITWRPPKVPIQMRPTRSSAKDVTGLVREAGGAGGRPRVVAERPGRGVPAVRAAVAGAHPEHAALVLVERHHVVVGEARRVRRVVPVVGERRLLAVQEVEPGVRADPEAPGRVLVDRAHAVVAEARRAPRGRGDTCGRRRRRPAPTATGRRPACPPRRVPRGPRRPRARAGRPGRTAAPGRSGSGGRCRSPRRAGRGLRRCPPTTARCRRTPARTRCRARGCRASPRRAGSRAPSPSAGRGCSSPWSLLATHSRPSGPKLSVRTRGAAAAPTPIGTRAKRSVLRSQRATPPPSVPIQRSPCPSSAIAHTRLSGRDAGSAGSYL